MISKQYFSRRGCKTAEIFSYSDWTFSCSLKQAVTMLNSDFLLEYLQSIILALRINLMLLIYLLPKNKYKASIIVHATDMSAPHPYLHAKCSILSSNHQSHQHVYIHEFGRSEGQSGQPNPLIYD